MVHGVDQIWPYLYLQNILNGDKINLFNYGNHIRILLMLMILLSYKKDYKKD